MSKRLSISLVSLLALAALVVLPSLAQAETKELVSGASNSLCIEPTARPEFIPARSRQNPTTRSNRIRVITIYRSTQNTYLLVRRFPTPGWHAQNRL